MTRIEAIIQPSRFESVKEALHQIGVEARVFEHLVRHNPIHARTLERHGGDVTDCRNCASLKS